MKIEENVSLKDFSTFKIGGMADFFCLPESADDILAAVSFAQKRRIPVFVLGGGSNIVFSDDGVEGLVVCTKKMSLIAVEGDLVCAECGSQMKSVCSLCAESGKSGLEEFFGLPCTAGGAVRMNARCYEKSISDVFFSAEFLDFSSKTVETVGFSPHDWDYKKSPFQQKNGIILEASLKVCQGERQKIAAAGEKFLRDREEKGHFRFPSAGSVFKNCRDFGLPSGKIVEECGLRGAKSGGARIAPWHGNFIINEGNAKAGDVAALVQAAKAAALKKFGFALECEIIFVGRGF